MRPNPNITQTGKVTYLGYRAKSVPDHIRTTPAETLQLDVKGVVGDSHSMYFLPDPTRVYPPIKPALIKEKLETNHKIFKTAQVHLLDTNTARILSGLGISLGPGEVGEQILVDGVDLNMLHSGTTISIGDTVKFKLISTRTFCRKFSYDITNPTSKDPNMFHNSIKHLILSAETNGMELPPHIGVYAQVIEGGSISIGDTVITDPTTSEHYNKTNIPQVPVATNDINAVRFQWFTFEQLQATDKLSTISQLNSFFNKE